MSRLIPDGGAAELMAQPRRTALAAALLTVCAMIAVTQKGIQDTGPVLAAVEPVVEAIENLSDAVPARAENRSEPAASGIDYSNPVIAGNYPDPSVIRVGQDYWATATSAGWAPQFPIMHSRNLADWEVVGSVFQDRPRWSNGDYWAPEISHYRDRFYIYYVAQKRGGARCVAVATAQRPTGPYQDHGPLVCQPLGSIDPMAVNDENGRRYLVWKEAGNRRNLPTPIWAQQLSPNGLNLVGERVELLRNDAPWEGKIVEAPFILQRDDWFYMFYSGNDCCSPECGYALGVARSPHLLGPWEKNPTNPILKGNSKWLCPGHGSVVSDMQGRDYLLYHAYQEGARHVGRQALLAEVNWGSDQWPVIESANAASESALLPVEMKAPQTGPSFAGDFTSQHLNPTWQWPQANKPLFRIEEADRGWLFLSPTRAHAHDVIGAVVARSTRAGDYIASTLVDARNMKPGARAGLAAYGDRHNALGITLGDGKITLWRREQNRHEIVATAIAPDSPFVHLRMAAFDGNQFRFAVSRDGRDWTFMSDKHGYDLPPWNHAVRVALTSGGVEGAVAKFDWLRIGPVEDRSRFMLADAR